MTVKELQMIVYRFEKNGIGPYVSRTGRTLLTYHNKDTRTGRKYTSLFNKYYHSLSDEERIKNYAKAHSSRRYMYGCRNKEYLRAYFGGDFKSLFKEGFRIKRYKVPDEEVIDMGIEVAFPVQYHKLQSVTKLRKVI